MDSLRESGFLTKLFTEMAPNSLTVLDNYHVVDLLTVDDEGRIVMEICMERDGSLAGSYSTGGLLEERAFARHHVTWSPLSRDISMTALDK
jgi:hypothetical protein